MPKGHNRARLRSAGAGWTTVIMSALAVIMLFVPGALASYAMTSWTSISSSQNGYYAGTGSTSPTSGQPTTTGSLVNATFGFTVSAGTGTGFAVYNQTVFAYTSATFSAWKGSGTYDVDLITSYQMAANDLYAAVDCTEGGSAIATAIIAVNIAVYDQTTSSYAYHFPPEYFSRTWNGNYLGGAQLGVQGTTPITCSGVGSFSSGSASQSRANFNATESGIALTLIPAQTYVIEGNITAAALAVTTGAATASASVTFSPGDYVQMVQADVW